MIYIACIYLHALWVGGWGGGLGWKDFKTTNSNHGEAERASEEEDLKNHIIKQHLTGKKIAREPRRCFCVFVSLKG